MAERLSEEDFAKHLHTKFRVRPEGGEPVELELESVAGYQGGANEQAGMARFSLFFEGPPDVFVTQGTRTFDHEQLGEVTLFIVPIARTERGFRYESVFNYFKE
ncbi:MAG TPA: hypothetical protein VFS10_20550 [Pyrinomonadaceae bacterium]|jgi:hypothetical protein|nr:hypothetical protein [Pyrinomonadaceae bacterium]